MIEQLIKLTNEKEFYQEGNINLISTKSEIGFLNISEFNFAVEDRDKESNLQKVTYWKIIAHRTIEIRNFQNSVLLPYVKLKILENHPLLWNYREEDYECQLIGFPEKPIEFIGNLFFEFEKLTGNWLNLSEYMYDINQFYKKNNSVTISIPKPLKEVFEKVCLKHNVKFKVENIINLYNKGYRNRPNAKLLIFGNEDVSPNDFNLQQPYIIADYFMATNIE